MQKLFKIFSSSQNTTLNKNIYKTSLNHNSNNVLTDQNNCQEQKWTQMPKLYQNTYKNTQKLGKPNTKQSKMYSKNGHTKKHRRTEKKMTKCVILKCLEVRLCKRSVIVGTLLTQDMSRHKSQQGWYLNKEWWYWREGGW